MNLHLNACNAGIELSLSEDGDVWLRVESERPVFVLSDYLTHAAALDRDRNANLAHSQQSQAARGSSGNVSSSPEAAAEPGPGSFPASPPTYPNAAAAALNGNGGPARDQCGSARPPSTSASDHVHKIYPNSTPIKVRRSLTLVALSASASARTRPRMPRVPSRPVPSTLLVYQLAPWRASTL